MKQKISNFILVIIFVIGLSLLLYPIISDFWNSNHQSGAIASYEEKVALMDHNSYDEIWQDATEYNEKLAINGNKWILTDDEKKEYEKLLNITDSGVMGYIDIPSIDCKLPVYHGIDKAVLQIAVGHIEGSSLPVGGNSTHAVLSGHRGLPSARLFSDLDRMVEGDTFMLHILDRTLTYEVDQISIVLPNELDMLKIEENKDLCTLVTCTPYGVNSHRLLVTGHRVENVAGEVHVTADALQIDPIMVAPLIASLMLLVLLIILLVKSSKKKK